jgi:hypothetical protein
MPLAALHIASAFLDFLAAGQSLAFVWKRRLGRVWLLVFLALLVKGSLSVGMTFTEPASRLAALNESQVPLAELFVSLLMASGFVLTGQWFGVKERLEARFQLIAEVDRSLVGALEEERILSTVCDVLSRREGYRLAWVGVGEPDGSIRVERSAGEATAFLGEVAFRWDGTPSGDTPPGISLRTGETRVLLPGEPVGKAFGEGCRRNGLRSCASSTSSRTRC